MEILKHGNIKKLEFQKFCCKECGCVFIADNTEYTNCIAEPYAHYDLIEFSCICPTCGQTVYIPLKKTSKSRGFI